MRPGRGLNKISGGQLGNSRWIVAGLVIALTMSGGGATFAADDEITLGTTVPMSGRYVRGGTDTKNGYDLAIRQINKKGGVKIAGKQYRLTALYYDDQSNPQRAQQLIEQLIKTDGIKFILGPYSVSQNQNVQSTVELNKVPMVEAHSVTRSRRSPRPRYTFAVTAAPDGFFTPALELAAAFSKKFGKRAHDLSIAMATKDDAFSREVREGVLSDANRLGIACVIDDQLPEDFADMSATLDKVKALKPDLFLVSGHESTAMTVISQIEQAGADVPMVASTHCVKARLALERKGSSQLLFCPVQWNKSARYKGALFGTGKDFTRLYTSVYGYEPSPESAQAAAAVYVFADAFKRAQSLEPEKVRDAISTTNLLTFFGPIKFDDRGVNSSKPMLLTQIVDGDFVLVAPQNWAEREPVIKKAKP